MILEGVDLQPSLPISDEDWKFRNESILAELNRNMFRRLAPTVLVLVVMMLIGAVGNFIICYIFIRKMKRNCQNLLLLSLGSFDLMSSCIGVPSEIADLRHYFYYESVPMCKIMRFFTTFPSIASILILLSIAADRFLKICRPLHRQMEVFHAKLCIGLTVTISAVFSVPALYIYGYRTLKTEIPGLYGHDCSVDDRFKGQYFPLLYEGFFAALFLCFSILLTVLYVRIWFETRRHRRYMRRHTSLAVVMMEDMTSSTDYVVERRNSDAKSGRMLRLPFSAIGRRRKGDRVVKCHVSRNVVAIETGNEGGNQRVSAGEADSLERSEPNLTKAIETRDGKVDSNCDENKTPSIQSNGDSQCVDQVDNSTKLRLLENQDDVIIAETEGGDDENDVMLDEDDDEVFDNKKSPKVSNVGHDSQSHVSKSCSDISQGRKNGRKLLPFRQKLGGQRGGGKSESKRKLRPASKHGAEEADPEQSRSLLPRPLSNLAKGKSLSTSLSNLGRSRKPSASASANDQVKPRFKATPQSLKVMKALRAKRTTVIAFVVTAGFIFSYLPHLILIILRSALPDFDHRLDETGLIFYNIFLRSYFANNVINVFVYGTMNLEFRAQLADVWRFLTKPCMKEAKEVT